MSFAGTTCRPRVRDGRFDSLSDEWRDLCFHGLGIGSPLIHCGPGLDPGTLGSKTDHPSASVVIQIY